MSVSSSLSQWHSNNNRVKVDSLHFYEQAVTHWSYLQNRIYKRCGRHLRGTFEIDNIFNVWPWRKSCMQRGGGQPEAHTYPWVNHQPHVHQRRRQKHWCSAYRTWESVHCGRGYWKIQVHTDLSDWKNNEVHTSFIPGLFLDASKLHFSTTGKDAAVCQGQVGHTPLVHFRFPTHWLDLRCTASQEKHFPVAISSFAKTML